MQVSSKKLLQHEKIIILSANHTVYDLLRASCLWGLLVPSWIVGWMDGSVISFVKKKVEKNISFRKRNGHKNVFMKYWCPWLKYCPFKNVFTRQCSLCCVVKVVNFEKNYLWHHCITRSVCLCYRHKCASVRLLF